MVRETTFSEHLFFRGASVFITVSKPPTTQKDRQTDRLYCPHFQGKEPRLSELSNCQLAGPGNQTHSRLAPKPAPTVTCYHLPPQSSLSLLSGSGSSGSSATR